ncbi:hypothetical protein PG985_014241 [Apiospora marii]|uniref:uncharacterized protein n=1 Tax=Apiospora marii TaxID=335849 RepID=UPI003130C51A
MLRTSADSQPDVLAYDLEAGRVAHEDMVYPAASLEQLQIQQSPPSARQTVGRSQTPDLPPVSIPLPDYTNQSKGFSRQSRSDASRSALPTPANDVDTSSRGAVLSLDYRSSTSTS